MTKPEWLASCLRDLRHAGSTRGVAGNVREKTNPRRRMFRRRECAGYDKGMRWLTITPTMALAALACVPIVANQEKSKTDERLDDAASLFSEVMTTPDKAIPQDLLNKSQCIILVPSLKQAAFVVGAKYGRGFVMCRAAGGPGWGPPAAVRIEGGS